MFDLNAAIADWRHRMSAQPDFQAGDIDELEDHLREIVEEVRAKGIPEEEAFLVAVHRLGDPDQLAGEFAAADPRLRRRLRLRWIIMGGLVVMALLAFAELVGMMSLGRLGFLQARSPLLGWSWAAIQLVILALGGILVWRVLTGDNVARRIFGHAVWILGLLLLILAAGLMIGRMGALTLHAGMPALPEATVPLRFLPLAPWTRVVLLVMPALLLIGLLGLLDRRPRPPR